MRSIDLNCDMGEGAGQDEQIMPYISSANIACGYHAGDEKTIWETIGLAIRHGVKIGAHVSFPDRDHFGRKEMNISPEQVYDLVVQQLIIFDEVADSFDLRMHHVKPHGALYNMSAKDPVLAAAIARAINEYNANLILFGLSNSHSISAAKSIGLKTVSEVFADRSYQDDGTLTPRHVAGALIDDSDMAIRQVIQMIEQGTVRSLSGKEIPLVAETVCLHGDGVHAVPFAKKINETLKQHSVEIKAI